MYQDGSWSCFKDLTYKDLHQGIVGAVGASVVVITLALHSNEWFVTISGNHRSAHACTWLVHTQAHFLLLHTWKAAGYEASTWYTCSSRSWAPSVHGTFSYWYTEGHWAHWSFHVANPLCRASERHEYFYVPFLMKFMENTDTFLSSARLAPITSRREDKDYTFPPWSTSTQTVGIRRSLDINRRHITTNHDSI